jgi:hypothetical protein
METTIDMDDREVLPPETDDTKEEVPVRKDSKTRLDYIKNVKGSYLVHAKSGKILGKHPTKVAALKQLRAIEANK